MRRSNSQGAPMRVYSKRVGLLPHMEPLVVAHESKREALPIERRTILQRTASFGGSARPERQYESYRLQLRS